MSATGKTATHFAAPRPLAEQDAKLAEIEAAPDAPESLRIRVANAAHDAACGCGDITVYENSYWAQVADAAIAVMRGDR